MDLGGRIKDLRVRDGFSQEALAGRIYVTRQTIINWETGRSYPDVQSLLLLGAVFDVSIDEMVKGDIDTMKHELDVYRLRMWCAIIIAAVVLATVCGVPLYVLFGIIGLIPSFVLAGFAILGIIIIDRIAKRHCLPAFEEIVAFVDTGKVATGWVAWARRHSGFVFVCVVVVLYLLGFVFGFLLEPWMDSIERLIG